MKTAPSTGPAEGPEAAGDDHDDDHGHLVELHRRGREQADVVPLEAARHGGEGGGDDEGRALPLEGVEAHHGGRFLVVADGPQVGADPGVDDLPDHEERGEGESEEE